jgi:flagellar secretion chaperone FliS
MYAMSARGAAAYRQTSVQSSSPLQLVVLLYDGAIKHISAAREAMGRGDLVARRDGLSRAMAIVAELQSTLNLKEGGEVAESLDRLYVYVLDLIVQANVRSDPRALEAAERLLGPLRDAWSQVASGAPPPLRP